MVTFPKVSILIPVYNRDNLIMETLESAVNQTYKNIEVIVVDNKSTDNTFEIVKEFAKLHPNVKVYQNEENIGPVRNWRRCLDYATGEYVKILWSDDLIAPDFIEKTLPYLMDHEDVGFVFTGVEVFFHRTGRKEKIHFFGNTNIYDTKKYIENSLLGGPVPGSPGSALFRRKDLEENLLLDIPNKFSIDFKMHAIGNDVLIYLLTANKYPKFAFINEKLSFFRAWEGSITLSTNGSFLSMLHLIARAYFVENYLKDNALRKKFNSRIMFFLLRGHGRKSGLGIKTVRDFYFDRNKADIDYIFISKLIADKLFKTFLRKIPGKN
ncbi:MAG: glycosyl transferase [Candidatus Cloacimonas sp. 4484_209]|nr:MAG: glycosyl transferase [Candidatus Cloacimonas sp. 4484_209]